MTSFDAYERNYMKRFIDVLETMLGYTEKKTESI